MTVHRAPSALPDDAVNAVRSMLVASSVVGIVLGVIALAWPNVTLAVVAVLFGASLIVVGLFRLFLAFATTAAPFVLRMVLAGLGVVVLAAGVLAVLNPVESLTLLGVVIGVGWIFAGMQDLFGARLNAAVVPRWLVTIGGVVSIGAGIAMIVLPSIWTLSTILWILAVLLIATSVATLLTLPRQQVRKESKLRKRKPKKAKAVAAVGADTPDADDAAGATGGATAHDSVDADDETGADQADATGADQATDPAGADGEVEGGER